MKATTLENEKNDNNNTQNEMNNTLTNRKD